jgi:hypothetical protein
VRTPLLNAALATSTAALCILTSLAAHAAVAYPPPGGGGSPGHGVTFTPLDGGAAGPLQPDQLVVCSRGAHSDVIIDNLTTPSDTPNPGPLLLTIPKDRCGVIVSGSVSGGPPNVTYPIDGTYRISLQGLKERPLACEDVTHDPDCKLPFHHIEVTHAAQPGVTDIDTPETTVTISSLDGVRVDFVHRGDYYGADRRTGSFEGQNPAGPPNGY